MKKYLVLIALFFAGNAFAQSGNVGLLLAFPQGEFKDNVKKTGVGVGFDALFFKPTPEAPFAFGVSAAFLTYGNENRNEPFSSTIPDVRVNVERSNNIGSLMALFRISTNNTLMRPYADVLFGGSYLYTETKIQSRINNQEVVSDKNFDDFALNYGFGAGVVYKIFENKDNDTGKKISYFLDVRARYIWGSKAEYLKEGSIVIGPGSNVQYNVFKSKTDLLQAQIGIFAEF